MEIEGKMDGVEARPVILGQSRDVEIGLADEEPVARILGQHGPHLAGDVEDARRVGAVDRDELLEGRIAGAEVGVGRVVAELGVLHHVPDDVDPEAVDAALQPEAHGVVDRRPHRRIAPVEIGLLLQEGVVVVLPGGRVEFPGAAAGLAHPVVGRAAARRRVAPDVPVAARIAARAARFLEPGMGARAVVGHEVQQQTQAAAMQRPDQPIQIRKRAEKRIDRLVVADVVAEIGHRRGKDGRDPDGADAEPDEMVDPSGDAVEVADPVAVAVLKGPGIDLVDDGILPPGASGAHVRWGLPKPSRRRPVWTSGQLMKRRHRRALRWFSIITTIGP